MRFHDLTWMALERRLAEDDRIVVPIGSTEQHGYLSLGTDTVIAERLALDACEGLEIPVLPALPFGHAPEFGAFPGSPSLRAQTLAAVLTDILGSLHEQGFGRILVLNAHSTNEVASEAVAAWGAENPRCTVRFVTWFYIPSVRAHARTIDPHPSHANWQENFPWTRIAGVDAPAAHKPIAATAEVLSSSPQRVRELLGDGSFGSYYARPAQQMEEFWRAAVEAVRDILVTGWDKEDPNG